MKQIAPFLLLFLSAALVSAQDPDWHRPPAQDLQGNRGEIARILHNTTDENIMLEVWRRPGVDEDTLFLKMLAGKRLGLYGTAAAVPVLVPRIGVDQDSFFARYALETIPGNEVDIALAEALKNIEYPPALAGVLTTLGVRANPIVAQAVVPFITHEDADVRNAAAYAFACTASTMEDVRALFRHAHTVGGEMQFPVDAALLYAERLRANGQADPDDPGAQAAQAARALYIYYAIITGEASLAHTANSGRLVFDTQEHQHLAAILQNILATGQANIMSAVTLMVEQLVSDSPRNFAVGLMAARQLPGNDDLNANATVAGAMIARTHLEADPFRKSLLIRAFGDRTDTFSRNAALHTISQFIRSPDEVVRVAAIDALRNVGNPSVVPILLEAAQSDVQSIAHAARNTLAAMPGEEIDAAIIALLAGTPTPAVKVIAIGLVEERRIFAAAPILVTALSDSNPAVSEAAASALGQISGVEELAVLLGLLRRATSEAEAQRLLRVLISAGTRLSQDASTAEVAKALEGASTELKTQLLDLLREIAGRRALEIVESYAWGNDAQMRNVATRILGEWRAPADLDQLAAACLRLAREHEEYKVRGLRSYIRLARQFNMPDERRLRMSQEVFELADRDEERALVFDVFARVVSLASLDAAVAHIDSEAFRERAAETAVSIAERLQGRNERITNAMQKVIEASTNASIRERAGRVLAR